MKFVSVLVLVGTTLLALIYGSVTPLQASGSGSSENEMTRRLSGRIVVDPAVERECAARLLAMRPANTVWRQQRRERSLFDDPPNNRAPIFADREGWLTQDVAEVQRSLAAAAAYERANRMQEEAPAQMEEGTHFPSLTTLSPYVEERSEPSPLRPSFMLGLFSERLAEPVIAMMRHLIDQKELSDDEKREQLRMLETFITRAREEHYFNSIWPLYEEAVRIVSEQSERSPSSELNAGVSHLSLGDS